MNPKWSPILVLSLLMSLAKILDKSGNLGNVFSSAQFF